MLAQHLIQVGDHAAYCASFQTPAPPLPASFHACAYMCMPASFHACVPTCACAYMCVPAGARSGRVGRRDGPRDRRSLRPLPDAQPPQGPRRVGAAEPSRPRAVPRRHAGARNRRGEGGKMGGRVVLRRAHTQTHACTLLLYSWFTFTIYVLCVCVGGVFVPLRPSSWGRPTWRCSKAAWKTW